MTISTASSDSPSSPKLGFGAIAMSFGCLRFDGCRGVWRREVIQSGREYSNCRARSEKRGEVCARFAAWNATLLP